MVMANIPMPTGSSLDLAIHVFNGHCETSLRIKTLICPS